MATDNPESNSNAPNSPNLEHPVSPLTQTYPQQVLDVFKLASEQEMEIVLADNKAAHALRFKFNHIRKLMRAENHPLLPLAEQVTFTIPRERPHILIAGPVDLRYKDALTAVLAPHKERLDSEREIEQRKLSEEEQAWLALERDRLTEKHLTSKQKSASASLMDLLAKKDHS